MEGAHGRASARGDAPSVAAVATLALSTSDTSTHEVKWGYRVIAGVSGHSDETIKLKFQDRPINDTAPIFLWLLSCFYCFLTLLHFLLLHIRAKSVRRTFVQYATALPLTPRPGPSLIRSAFSPTTFDSQTICLRFPRIFPCHRSGLLRARYAC